MGRLLAAPIAEENVGHLAGHVKGGQQHAKDQHVERRPGHAPVLGRLQNAVLAPEAGEEQRKPAQRQHSDRIGDKGQRHINLEPAHTPDVLLSVAAVNHGPRAQEQKRFEKGVGNQMEDAYRNAAHAEAGHHVAELRDGGVSQNALDVVLRHGDQRGKDCRRSTNPGDHRQRRRGSAGQRAGLHQRIDSGDQVNARSHHGRRVNQGGNRRRAFHGVRQPHMQRKLAALARRPGKDQQADRARGGQPSAEADGRLRQQSGQRICLHRTRAIVVKEQRAGLREEPHHSEKKEDVADPRGDEGFLSRCRGLGLLIPIADQ